MEQRRKHVRVILPCPFNAQSFELTHGFEIVRFEDGEHCWNSFVHFYAAGGALCGDDCSAFIRPAIELLPRIGGDERPLLLHRGALLERQLFPGMRRRNGSIRQPVRFARIAGMVSGGNERASQRLQSEPTPGVPRFSTPTDKMGSPFSKKRTHYIV